MKHTTRLIACLLALALTACTAAPRICLQARPPRQPAAPAQTAEPTTETPAVQDTLTPIYTTWGAAVGQDAVYSAMNIDDAGNTSPQRLIFPRVSSASSAKSSAAAMRMKAAQPT